MELVKWANKQGHTLLLTDAEAAFLERLLPEARDTGSVSSENLAIQIKED